ncbi:hypothetical protein P4O66_013877 [Electrophorus voltai]|uniref:t-SNARE coiled-coil homology domain-containing protein n=1 Tax=Electrophorus voltai TaxID=2609070 RepID=A0AAD8Z2T7_9TELE|nr:hypothetical protein P4O66_013877 [Electrophorus voltai]
MKDRLAQLKEETDQTLDVEIPVEKKDFMDEFFAQIKEIRTSIDKIDANVTEIKHLYSVILSAPTSDQKTQDDIEAITNEIKKLANNARYKLKSDLESITEERLSADMRIKKSQVPQHLSQISGTLAPVPNLRYPSTCAKFQVPQHLSQNSGTPAPVPKLRYPSTCPKSQVPQHLCQILGTLAPVPNLRYPSTCAKFQHAILGRKFVDVMTKYNEAQVEFREKSKGRIQRQLEITGKTTTDEELEEMLDGGNVAVFTAGYLYVRIMASGISKQALSEIEARHKDIMRLESSIKELHDMFVDIAVLVENQGSMIDRIETNMDQSVGFVERAVADTKKAAKFQKEARRMNR